MTNLGNLETPLAKCEQERDEARRRIAGLEQAYDNAVTRRFKARVSLAGCARERDEALRQLNELRGWVRETIANLEFWFPENALATLKQAESIEEK